MKRRRCLLFCFLILVAFIFFSSFLLSRYLSNLLSNLFGMSVKFESVYVNPFGPWVHGYGVRFENQEGYTKREHLRVEKLSTQVDLFAFFDKQVNLKKVILKDMQYLIEQRTVNANRQTTNLNEWIDHIRPRKGKKSSKGEGSGWIVDIDEIVIEKGAFIFDGLSDNDYFFSALKGYLKGFKWPTSSPTDLGQVVKLEGRLGNVEPVKVKFYGFANFATSQVSFDLHGAVMDGNVKEYRRFWADWPIDIRSGRYDLVIHMKCVKKQIETKSELRLRRLEVKSGSKTTDKFLGLPLSTATKFLESEQEILLNVPVSGIISDPEFDFPRAFQKAFQSSFTSHLQKGVDVFVKAPMNIAKGTQEIFVKGTEVASELAKTATKVKEEVLK